MAEYYTLETIRDQVLQNGWSVNSVYFSPGGDPRTYDMLEHFPSDWKYCPCNTLPLCEQRQTRACFLRVGISTYDKDNVSTSLFIEVIYLRERQVGVVRKEQTLLRPYIDTGKIRREALATIVA